MNGKQFLIGVAVAILAVQQPLAAPAQGAKKGVMLMNRIGPSASELYIANADGTDERKLLEKSVFDYHPAFSADGSRIAFVSTRGSHKTRDEAPLYDNTFQPYGQNWLMNADGSGQRMITDDSPWEDSVPLYIPTTH